MTIKSGSLLCLFALSTAFLFADDIYFSNSGQVWKNCRIVDISQKKVQILFREKHGTITVDKRITSVFGVVPAPMDPASMTRIRRYSREDLKERFDQKDIHSIFHAVPEEHRQNNDLMGKLNRYLEHDYIENALPRKNTFEGLGLHARNELNYLYNYQGVMSDEERMMHYSSKLRNPMPAAFTNVFGIASLVQKDYEFGFIIMACEIGGILVLSHSRHDKGMIDLGLTLLDLGLIMSIVRPFDLADKYNKALMAGLQFEP